jgi:hypothetical protein
MENRIKECQRDLFAGRTSALRPGLLKIGALVRRSVRRIKLAIGASASSRVRPHPCETGCRRHGRGPTNRTPQAAIHSDNALRHPAMVLPACYEPDPPSAGPRLSGCCSRPPIQDASPITGEKSGLRLPPTPPPRRGEAGRKIARVAVRAQPAHRTK